MDRDLRTKKLETLVDDVAEGVRLTQAGNFREALNVLMKARSGACELQHRSAFVEWHIAIAHDGLCDYVTALRFIASALAMDHFVPPFRASCEIIVGNARREMQNLPPKDRTIRDLYKGIVKLGAATIADHLRAGMHYSACGDRAAALAALDAVLAIDPECDAAQIGRAALVNGLLWRGDETDGSVEQRAEAALAEALAKGQPVGEA